ncbi:MAG: hypothetical protein WBN76_09340, partial [Azonexus sp.]
MIFQHLPTKTTIHEVGRNKMAFAFYSTFFDRGQQHASTCQDSNQNTRQDSNEGGNQACGQSRRHDARQGGGQACGS